MRNLTHGTEWDGMEWNGMELNGMEWNEWDAMKPNEISERMHAFEGKKECMNE